MASPLQNTITFFKDFGLFDVVLPFLLVFALIFAILEKTKILGVEKTKEEESTKKSLNTIVAFVIAMLVVAANKIVTAINTALPNVVLVIITFFSFLLMIGIFMGTGEFNFSDKHKKTMLGFMAVSLIVLALIIFDSIRLDASRSWLDFILEYVTNNLNGPVVTSAIFLLIALGAVFYITKPNTSKG